MDGCLAATQRRDPSLLKDTCTGVEDVEMLATGFVLLPSKSSNLKTETPETQYCTNTANPHWPTTSCRQ